jgi:hypothetical protein
MSVLLASNVHAAKFVCVLFVYQSMSRKEICSEILTTLLEELGLLAGKLVTGDYIKI